MIGFLSGQQEMGSGLRQQVDRIFLQHFGNNELMCMINAGIK